VAITNGKYTETGNNGYTRHGMKTNKQESNRVFIQNS